MWTGVPASYMKKLMALLERLVIALERIAIALEYRNQNGPPR